MDPCDLKCLCKLERRQDRGQTLRKHRLARSGRTDEQNVVPTGTCHLKSTLGGLLTTDLIKVQRVVGAVVADRRQIELVRLHLWRETAVEIGRDLRCHTQG